MIQSVSTPLTYNAATAVVRVKNEFAEIIGKLGKEAAREKCWKRVTEQKSGKEVLIAAKAFSIFYPSSAITTFEFADNTTLFLSSSQIEALKIDSAVIRDLLDDSEGDHIPLTLITRLQFLALFNLLYPSESFEKASIDLFDMVLAANYLDIQEVLDSLLKQLNAQISTIKAENNLSSALRFYDTLKKLPKDLREPLECKLGSYFGLALVNTPREKRADIISQYDRFGITTLSFASKKNILLNDLAQIRSLRVLDLSFTDLKDENIKDIPSDLITLKLNGCSAITDEGIDKLPKGLAHLDLSGCTKITDKGLAKFSNNLKSLELNGCIKITDVGVASLPKGLTRLDLGGCTKVTYIGVAKLPRNLRSLNLSCCVEITDKAIDELPQSLSHLSLRYCFQISNEGIGKLPQTLTYVNLDRCDQITDKGIDKLPRNLTRLSLNRCYQITNVGIEKLPQGLSDLNLSGCNKITDAGIEERPRSLSRLTLKGCVKITKAKINALRLGGIEVIQG